MSTSGESDVTALATSEDPMPLTSRRDLASPSSVTSAIGEITTGFPHDVCSARFPSPVRSSGRLGREDRLEPCLLLMPRQIADTQGLPQHLVQIFVDR